MTSLSEPWNNYAHLQLPERVAVFQQLCGHLERTPDQYAAPVIQQWFTGLRLRESNSLKCRR